MPAQPSLPPHTQAMPCRAAALLLPLLLAAVAVRMPAGEVAGGLLRLADGQVVVEVAPALGGRIATLRRPDGPNLIAFDPVGLAASPPVPAATSGFFFCLGGVVWLGPQSSWWSQQDANPERRDARASWPPDPYLDHGAMTVAERTPTAITLRGMASPVSGVRMTITVRLAGEGVVVEEIAAENATDRPVTWDLWPNTRVRAPARVFAPYLPGSRLKVQYGTADPAAEIPLPHRVRGGWLSFDTRLPADEAGLLHSAKAFLAAERPRLAAVHGRDLLLMAGRPVAAGDIHAEHAPVEVFQCVGGDPLRTILELEFHSACRRLAPGEALRHAVAWKVMALAGPGDEPGHAPADAAIGRAFDRLADALR